MICTVLEGLGAFKNLVYVHLLDFYGGGTCGDMGFMGQWKATNFLQIFACQFEDSISVFPLNGYKTRLESRRETFKF